MKKSNTPDLDKQAAGGHWKFRGDEPKREISLTPNQRKLAKKHGTPAEFAQAVYKCVPGDISMDEARAAVDKYNREWAEA